jgi:hypothetical protein
MTFTISIVGIASVLFALAVSVIVFRHDKQPGQIIPAVLGTVTTAIGTLAGLVAGNTAGAAGKERAEQRAQSNERDAVAGRALATAIKSDGLEETGGLERASASPGTAAAALRRYDQLARTLFP